jgi:excisionase family DNA binding protein
MDDEVLILLKSHELCLETSLQLIKVQIKSYEESLSKRQQVVLEVFEGYPEILLAEEIAEILRISPRYAYEIMERKDFPLIRIGGSKRVRKDEFSKWLKMTQIKNNRSK